jgi:hypothetical protein
MKKRILWICFCSECPNNYFYFSELLFIPDSWQVYLQFPAGNKKNLSLTF